MLKISTFFKNKITTPNLIFRNNENAGVNIIYYPELGSTGVDFINKYRKKNYWDYVVIPQAFMFLGHKVFTTTYHRDFKKNIPMIRIQRKFIKVNSPLKSVVIDLTSLSNNYAAFSKSRSKKQTTQAFLDLVEQFAIDSKTTSKETYLLIDNTLGDQKEMVDSLTYFSRLNSNKIRLKNIEGILLYGNRKFWPLTIKESDKDGEYFKINMNIMARYMKEVHGEEEKEIIKPEEKIDITRETVKLLYKVHKDKLKRSTNSISGISQKTDNIEENPLELIKNEVESNKHLKGKSFEEKLSNLFKENKSTPNKPNSKKAPGASNPESKIPQVVNNISDDIKKLNKRYNGTIELNESTVLKSRKSFYNPFNIIGYKDFNAYNKQDTEFGETLDQSIFDLIKSIESDKELGIKILNINTVITDTNRDRFKTYKIKLQHKSFGHEKPYTVSFHVPVPSKGKYIKLGGNDWIMINQFFPKPVIKIAPEMVRIYTHYNTASVFIKTHALNSDQDIKELVNNFGQSLKRTKKLKTPLETLEKEKAQQIIEKYNLPQYLNTEIFINFETKAV